MSNNDGQEDRQRHGSTKSDNANLDKFTSRQSATGPTRTSTASYAGSLASNYSGTSQNVSHASTARTVGVGKLVDVPPRKPAQGSAEANTTSRWSSSSASGVTPSDGGSQASYGGQTRSDARDSAISEENDVPGPSSADLEIMKRSGNRVKDVRKFKS